MSEKWFTLGSLALMILGGLLAKFVHPDCMIITLFGLMIGFGYWIDQAGR